MPQWLGSQVSSDAPSWNPAFALPSMLNWPKALTYEIGREHSNDPLTQVRSCLSIFASIATITPPPSYAAVFGSLFHSMTFVNSLESAAEAGIDFPWTYSSSVVAWYYAVYHGVRSMLFAWNRTAPENHAKTITAFESMRAKLPHPLNMVATRTSGEAYQAALPDYRSASPYDLERSFSPTKTVAQGMLLQYLRGTARWKAEVVKAGILKGGSGFTDFRTRAARQVRDSKLPSAINFMNCTYRYRTKSNYRDGLLFAYGGPDSRFDSTFASDLVSSARFVWVCALAFTALRVGRNPVREFLLDLDANLRSKERASSRVLFWRSFSGLLY